MNLMNTLKAFAEKGASPQELVMRAMGANSNPMLESLMQMAKNGNSADIENFARNFMKEKGRDFDREFAEFMKQMR